MSTSDSKNPNEPYFKKYTDLIPAQSDLVAMIQTQGEQFDAWLQAIAEEDSLKLHSPYTWSLREVVNHLSDCERVFAFRALWIARGGPMPMASFDENEFSRRAHPNCRTLRQLASELKSVRQSTETLFRGFSAHDWKETGTAATYTITVEEQATILIGHVAHHWEILKQRFA